MTCTLVDFSKDSITYQVAGCTHEELDNRLNLFFTAEKLRLHSDKPGEKIYQKGNRIARMFMGAWAKYFRLRVSISQHNEPFLVVIARDMNFYMSGGLIGLSSSRKEFERLNDLFKSNFGHRS